MIANSLLKRLSALITLILTLSGCAANRRTITPGHIPQQQSFTAQDQAYGEQVHRQLAQQYRESNDRSQQRLVRDMTLRLADAAGAGRQPWTTVLFDDDSVVNAAATRGNYIFVWTGLFKAAQTDDELAAVIGHEIGHVLARHPEPTTGETANQMIVGVAGRAASTGLQQSNIAGAGAQIGGALVQTLLKAAIINPESQRKEHEADHIGLFLMARAGYNPEAALRFWSRMGSMRGGTFSGPSIFSTHPPTEERIQEIQTLLPEALRVYRQERGITTLPDERTTRQSRGINRGARHQRGMDQNAPVQLGPARRLRRW